MPPQWVDSFDAVRTVDQNATGVAVNLVEFARATGRSLRQAIVSALVAITLLLLVLWRRVTENRLWFWFPSCLLGWAPAH